MAVVYCPDDGNWYDSTPIAWPGGSLTPPPIAADAAESGWIIVATGTALCGQYGDPGATLLIRSLDGGVGVVDISGTYTDGEGPWTAPPGDLYRYSFGPNYDETDPAQNMPAFPDLPAPIPFAVVDVRVDVTLLYDPAVAAPPTTLAAHPLRARRLSLVMPTPTLDSRGRPT